MKNHDMRNYSILQLINELEIVQSRQQQSVYVPASVPAPVQVSLPEPEIVSTPEQI